MRFALLVAWREYAENAKTKGFWLGILLVPVIILLSVQVRSGWKRRARPPGILCSWINPAWWDR